MNGRAFKSWICMFALVGAHCPPPETTAKSTQTETAHATLPTQHAANPKKLRDDKPNAQILDRPENLAQLIVTILGFAFVGYIYYVSISKSHGTFPRFLGY